MSEAAKGTGAHGFAFEELIGRALGHLRLELEKVTDALWVMHIKNELQIRAYFQEPSLNGVDHMVQMEDPSGVQHLFLIQEKWKLVTKQNEVSQFLDCCARILARMPDYKGQIHRMWVSRTVPSANGEKSLIEGQAILVQCCTSQNLLAYMTVLVICETLGIRAAAEGLLAKMGSLLPSKEDGVLPEVEEANLADLTFQPVSNFGEKRVLKVTKDTVVRVVKGGV